MKSIYKLAYAAVLTLSALNFAPALASAQDEGGRFTLPHDVHWQNVDVPAGDYRFSVQLMGPSRMLMLTKVTGTPASFMLLVTDVASSKGFETPGLVIDSKLGKRYVSAMNLPEFDVDLRFSTPATSGKEVAFLHTASAASPGH